MDGSGAAKSLARAGALDTIYRNDISGPIRVLPAGTRAEHTVAKLLAIERCNRRAMTSSKLHFVLLGELLVYPHSKRYKHDFKLACVSAAEALVKIESSKCRCPVS